MDTVSIDLRGVSKTFPGQKALDDVSFRIDAGLVHCVLGQNGCGKSTLIKILSGYHAVDPGGSITVGGEAFGGSAQASAGLGLRFVHQQNGVIGELSTLENLALGVGYTKRWGRIDWSAERRRAEALLERVGRPDLDLDRPMSRARAVDRAEVAIARACDPLRSPIRFLFLDEPTAALPVSEVDHLMQLVTEVRDRGVGVVYVTHRLDEVFRIGDVVTVLRDGRHIATKPVADLDSSRLIELITGQRDAVVAQRHLGSGKAQLIDDRPVATSLDVRGLRSQLLRGVDVRVEPGEVVGVAGLDGSGREEVCYALVGAVPASYDRMAVAGRELEGRLSPTTTKRSGLVLAPGNRQPGSAVRDFTIRENLTLPFLASFRRMFRLRRRTETEATLQWIDRLNIRTSRSNDPTSALFSQLSGGNQQKVVLAKWLATGPRALLLDEPTSGVDVGAREAIYQVIRGQAERGMGVVLASSDIQDFLRICDRVLVIRNGEVALQLTGDDVTETSLLNALMTAPAVSHG